MRERRRDANGRAFNRTTMELKPNRQAQAERRITLLIEPLWN